MKKLLSILTISTLTASVPAPLLANTTVERTKRDVSTLTSKTNNDYLPIKQIKGISDNIYSLAVDSKDNIYFGTNNGVYKLTAGSDTPTKIINLSGSISSVAVDSNDNVYFLDNYAFVLKQGETAPTKIDGINDSKSIFIDKDNNVYFGLLLEEKG